jgi:hypothetical protein
MVLIELVRELGPMVAVMLTSAPQDCDPLNTWNGADFCPDGIVTLAGTLAIVESLL